MTPELLLWQLYRTNRISLRDLMSPDPDRIIAMYWTARISLPEMLVFLEMSTKAKAKAKAKKKKVRKRAKTDDK